jgi:hypothetical protein
MEAYIFQAALWCSACTEHVKATRERPAHVNESDPYSYDSDEWPKEAGDDGGGEADTPQHCDACGVFLRNPLTPEGCRYVAEAEGRGKIVREWRDFYGIAPAPRGIRSLPARDVLREHGLADMPDFHSLPSVRVAALLDVADSVGYQKRPDAPGSRGRMFYAALCRQARREAKESAR